MCSSTFPLISVAIIPSSRVVRRHGVTLLRLVRGRVHRHSLLKLISRVISLLIAKGAGSERLGTLFGCMLRAKSTRHFHTFVNRVTRHTPRRGRGLVAVTSELHRRKQGSKLVLNGHRRTLHVTRRVLSENLSQRLIVVIAQLSPSSLVTRDRWPYGAKDWLTSIYDGPRRQAASTDTSSGSCRQGTGPTSSDHLNDTHYPPGADARSSPVGDQVTITKAHGVTKQYDT